MQQYHTNLYILTALKTTTQLLSCKEKIRLSPKCVRPDVHPFNSLISLIIRREKLFLIFLAKVGGGVAAALLGERRIMSSGGGLSDIPLILQEEKKKRQWCSPGAIVNYINSLILLAAFIACVIVIGTVGSIQGNLKAYVDPDIPDTNTTNQPRHACYMFSSCKGDAIDNISHCYFKPRETNECEGAMVGYSIIALVCFVFFVVSLIYAILNLR